MRHDKCRKTQKYPVAGQNLYWSATTGNFGDVNGALKDAIYSWYNEVSKASQNDINRACSGGNFGAIGHFTQVVKDKAVAVGCAISRYTKDGWKTTLIACNYSFGNMCGEAVYVSGNPGSSCPNGRNSFYRNLCN
jgi:hypothetical protein